MKFYVILESAEYDSGDQYTCVLDTAFATEEEAESEVERLEKNPNNHKYSVPTYDYQEVEVNDKG